MKKRLQKAIAWFSLMAVMISDVPGLHSAAAIAADNDEAVTSSVENDEEDINEGKDREDIAAPAACDDDITPVKADISYKEAMAEASSPAAVEKEIVYQSKTDKQFPATDEWFAYFDENYPATRDQGRYETGWAHSAISLAEFYMINKGLADKSVDYSDLHMAYWTYTQGTSSKAAGDSRDKVLFSPVSDNGINSILDNGGGHKYAAETLMRGRGVAAESAIPYSWADNIADGGSLGAASERNDVAYLKNANLISIRFNEDLVKEAIIENGAAGIEVYADKAYYSEEYNSYFCTDSSSSNHALTIVGWDDNFPQEHFKECNGKLPPREGAWLVRNSHSSVNEESFESYFWLSYYDSTIKGAWTFQMMESFPWDNHYYYDSQLHDNGYYLVDVCEYANVFTANGEAGAEGERLEAVSFEMALVKSEGSHYTVKIYGGLKGNTPDTGTLIRSATTEGTVYFEGVYTVSLNSPVILDKGEKFAVVISFDEPGSSVVIERAVNDYNAISSKVGLNYGQSYVSTDRKDWADVKGSDKDAGNLVIAAMTCDTEKKAAVSKLELYPGMITLTKAGETKNVKLKLLDSNGEEAAASEYSYVSFESLNDSVAAVDNIGNIRAVSNGKTKVVARYADISAECDITVAIPAEGVTAVPVANIKNGDNIDWDKDKLVLECTTPGADIYYTLDGSEVSAESTRYASPVSFNAAMAGSTVKVNAFAVAEGLLPSDVISLSYNIPAKGKIKLTASPKGSVIKTTASGNVTLQARMMLGEEEEKPAGGFSWKVEDEELLTLHAGSNGRDATARLSGLKNGVTKVSVSADNAYGERLYADISISVDIATTGDVHIQPVSVNYLYAGEQISFDCDTAGANIYYSMEGTDSGDGDMLYSEPLTITPDMVGSRISVKAYAVKEGMYPSESVSADFSVKRGKPGKSPYDPQPDKAGEDGYVFLVKGQSFYVDPGIKWESGSKKVITVDKNGLVRAKNAGGARLSSKEDPETYMDFIVAVPALSITSKTLACGEEATVSLRCFVNGTDVSARFGNYIWESSNDEVVTVDEQGAVKAIGKGSAVIRAYINGKAAGVKVTVKDQITPGKLPVSDNSVRLVLNPLQNAVLKIDGVNIKKCEIEGEWQNIVTGKNGKVSCYENEFISLKPNGKISAKAAGECSFRLLPGGDADKAIDVEICVNEAVERVMYLQPGKARQVNISGIKNKGKDAAVWKSSDEDIAVVDQGRINARTEGECVISTDYKGFEFNIRVYVCSAELKTDEKLRPVGKDYELKLKYGDEPYELNWVNHPYQYPVFTNKKNNVVFVDQYEVIYVRGRGKTVLKANIHGRKINIKVTVQ